MIIQKSFRVVLAIAVILFFIIRCSNPKNSNLKEPIEPESFASPRTVNANPNPAHLSPEESLKSFRVPKGYHVELVASEPMIKEPVAIAWDGNAKMYVAQMETYMQDVNGTGEQGAISRIMLLEDTNHDGKMDKSSVFIDQLR
ncbi:MAG TPA: hypothetical protein VK543_16085, partial [Puia sp.]|nr:hypothetical protein [Puia sp.]